MDFAHSVIEWYAAHRRELPWRGIADPYRIWVSEIILQQTRVVQGRSYYERFVTAFPDVEALAAATEDEVLRLWQGLGYYSRARNMLKAARLIVARGGFPETYDEVRKLPGIGDYTAAAICSFAFDLPVAVVDGNVYRVLSRFFGIDTPIDTTQGKKYYAELAQNLLPAAHAADYNQGLMDFGALQCTVTSPDCSACPLSDACVAFARNAQQDFPVKARRPQVKERHFVYLYVESPKGVWLYRRAAGDIWQGLYEFPLLEFDHRPEFSEILQHPFVLQHLSAAEGWREVARDVKHQLTHRLLHADFYALQTSEHSLPPGCLAVPAEELDDYAMPELLCRLRRKL
ncbi:MAG: A/G-specific adenine glycosylase [Alloprevotella sp.]